MECQAAILSPPPTHVYTTPLYTARAISYKAAFFQHKEQHMISSKHIASIALAAALLSG